jgi:hypothetical protein
MTFAVLYFESMESGSLPMAFTNGRFTAGLVSIPHGCAPPATPPSAPRGIPKVESLGTLIDPVGLNDGTGASIINSKCVLCAASLSMARRPSPAAIFGSRLS